MIIGKYQIQLNIDICIPDSKVKEFDYTQFKKDLNVETEKVLPEYLLKNFLSDDSVFKIYVSNVKSYLKEVNLHD